MRLRRGEAVAPDDGRPDDKLAVLARSDDFASRPANVAGSLGEVSRHPDLEHVFAVHVDFDVADRVVDVHVEPRSRRNRDLDIGRHLRHDDLAVFDVDVRRLQEAGVLARMVDGHFARHPVDRDGQRVRGTPGSFRLNLAIRIENEGGHLFVGVLSTSVAPGPLPGELPAVVELSVEPEIPAVLDSHLTGDPATIGTVELTPDRAEWGGEVRGPATTIPRRPVLAVALGIGPELRNRLRRGGGHHHGDQQKQKAFQHRPIPYFWGHSAWATFRR